MSASPASSRRARGQVDPDPACWSVPATASSAPWARCVAGAVLQAKGFPYTLMDLLGDRGAGAHVPAGLLRHAAPALGHVSPLPRAVRLPRRAGHLHLRRHLERQSDRAASASRVCSARTSAPSSAAACLPATLITLVPVAAILVASIRLHFLDVLLHLRYRGPNTMPCDARLLQGRGDGLVPARLDHHCLRTARGAAGEGLAPGWPCRMGQPLLNWLPGMCVSADRGHHRHHAWHRPRHQPANWRAPGATVVMLCRDVPARGRTCEGDHARSAGRRRRGRALRPGRASERARAAPRRCTAAYPRHRSADQQRRHGELAHRMSVDGFELTFATNHLGPFLLTPAAAASAGADGPHRQRRLARPLPRPHGPRGHRPIRAPATAAPRPMRARSSPMCWIPSRWPGGWPAAASPSTACTPGWSRPTCCPVAAAGEAAHEPGHSMSSAARVPRCSWPSRPRSQARAVVYFDEHQVPQAAAALARTICSCRSLCGSSGRAG